MRAKVILYSALILTSISLGGYICWLPRQSGGGLGGPQGQNSGKNDRRTGQGVLRREFPGDRPDRLAGEKDKDTPRALIPAWRRKLTGELSEAGWQPLSIDAVLDQSASLFALLAEHDEEALEYLAQHLKELGTKQRLQDFLRRAPEVAGLLAGADDPDAIVELLDTTPERRAQLLGLFVRHVGRRDVAALTEALKSNSDLVCRLNARGLIGAEAIFLFPRTGKGAMEYETWLHDGLSERFSGPEEELASFLQFVVVQGRDLLARLNQDEVFRQRFRTRLWPKFVRVVSRPDEALEHYVDEPRLWDLLAHEQGEELLARRGLLAVALLFGPDAYPAALHRHVISALLGGNGATFKALTEGRFRKEEGFHALLKRSLPGHVLASAINNLFAAEDRYRPLLEKYNRLTDETLAEEVGPSPDGIETWLPLYTHYMIARKLYQGRDPTTDEWVEAGVDTAVDIATFVFPPAKLAGKGGSKVVSQGIKRTALKTAEKKLAQKTLTHLSKRGMERQVVRWGMRGTLAEMQQSFGAFAARKTACEITTPVRYFYRSTGANRETFKRLTGLDARLFMRTDGKVYVHVDRLALLPVKGYLNRCFEGLKEKGEKSLVEAGLKQARNAIPELPESNIDHFWRAHVAAWWLLNLDDPLERVGKARIPGLRKNGPQKASKY